MSSKHKKSSRDSRQSNYYPTRWSEWVWNEQYQRDARYREISEGEWEWEYAKPTAADTPGETPYSQSVVENAYTPRDRTPVQLPPLDEEELAVEPSDRNYRHDEVSDLTHRIAGTNIGSYSEDQLYAGDYQGPEGQEYEDYQGQGDKRREKSSSQHQDRRRRDKRKGSSSKAGDKIYENESWASEEYQGHQARDSIQDDFRESQQMASHPALGYYEPNASYNSSAYGATPPAQDNSFVRNIGKGNTKRDSDELDRRFVVHKSKEFYFGRVFKVLWSEPVGSGGTEITVAASHGERAFHKVRRFLIVSEKNRGHSICIPILTYGNQGVLKRGVHPEDHAVAYSSKRDGPFVLEREKGLMTKHAVRIEVINDSHKLDPLSRINYAKLYTVEHNVKVFFIGRVAKNYESDVMSGYNEAHPPFSNPGLGYHQGSHEDLTRGAEGNEPRYPLPEELPQEGVGPSTYQTYPTHPSNPNYTTTPNYPTNPTYPASSTYRPNSSDPAYDDGYD